MSKVIFCTVRNSINNKWLSDKLLQLTSTCQRWWADQTYPCYITDNYSELAQYANQAEWLVVQTAGDTILEQNHLWNKLHSIPDDVGMVAHICWYAENNVPHLHPQCLIIRTAAINNLDFNPKEVTCSQFSRSKEDMHAGRSPLEVFLTDHPPRLYNFLFGTDVLRQVLTNGYRAVNFDDDWRFGSSTWPIQSDNLNRILKDVSCPTLPARGFCFPENTTEQFSNSLRTMTSDVTLDSSQQLLIELANQVIELQNSKVVNLLHWDRIPAATHANHVVATASGFLAEITALRTNAESISFYDINPNTLKFKKSLYSEWDGYNYLEYASEWARSRGLTVEPKWVKGQELAAQHNLREVFDNWEYLKSLPKDFTQCDIVKDITLFVNLIKPNSVVHTSTILNYYLITALQHSQHEIDNAVKLIKDTGCQWFET